VKSGRLASRVEDRIHASDPVNKKKEETPLQNERRINLGGKSLGQGKREGMDHLKEKNVRVLQHQMGGRSINNGSVRKGIPPRQG